MHQSHGRLLFLIFLICLFRSGTAENFVISSWGRLLLMLTPATAVIWNLCTCVRRVVPLPKSSKVTSASKWSLVMISLSSKYPISENPDSFPPFYVRHQVLAKNHNYWNPTFIKVSSFLIFPIPPNLSSISSYRTYIPPATGQGEVTVPSHVCWEKILRASRGWDSNGAITRIWAFYMCLYCFHLPNISSLQGMLRKEERGSRPSWSSLTSHLLTDTTDYQQHFASSESRLQQSQPL